MDIPTIDEIRLKLKADSEAAAEKLVKERLLPAMEWIVRHGGTRTLLASSMPSAIWKYTATVLADRGWSLTATLDEDGDEVWTLAVGPPGGQSPREPESNGGDRG